MRNFELGSIKALSDDGTGAEVGTSLSRCPGPGLLWDAVHGGTPGLHHLPTPPHPGLPKIKEQNQRAYV